MELLAQTIIEVILPTVRFFCFLIVFPTIREIVPTSVVACLSVALGLHARFQLSPPLPSYISGTFFTNLCVQVLSGLLIALPFLLVVEMFRQSLRAWDIFRGAQYAEQINPNIGERQSMLEGATSLFFAAAVMRAGLYQPVLKFFSLLEVSAGTSSLFAEQYYFRCLQLAASAFTAACVAVFPILILGLIFDLCGGALLRISPQLGISLDFISAKLVGGLVVLTLLCSSYGERFSEPFEVALQLAHDSLPLIVGIRG